MPRIQDQSNKDFHSITKTSAPLTMQLFFSLHIAYVRIGKLYSKQRSYHVYQTNSSNQKSTSATLLGITQWTSNIGNTKKSYLMHKAPSFCKVWERSWEAATQCNNKWSMVSPHCLHMQHQSTNIIPLLIRFSPVRFFPHFAVQTKNVAFLGATSDALPRNVYPIENY